MADAPLAAVSVTEQACGREEEPTPAPHPQGCVIVVDFAEHRLDLIAIAVEIGEPVERSALVMHPAPAPFPLHLEDIGIWANQMMTRHPPAGEEMLRDPVFAFGAIEQIGARTMGEDVQEEQPAGLQP